MKTDYTTIKNQADACKTLDREEKPGEELKDIADAMNKLDDNYKPKQGSWTPYFRWDYAGGFAFSHSGHDGWHSGTASGARLAFRFRTEEAADYFGTQFIDLHKKHFNS